MSKKGLTPREKEFCLRYCETMDSQEAARLSGYRKEPLRRAEALLVREDIQREISRLSESFEAVSRRSARRGYEKLAFGSISDAISLLYLKNPDKAQIEELDLYCVSEIKTKDGCMEIKFFDRLKALEKLSEKKEESKEREEALPPVYDAILKGAMALGGKKECESFEA